MKCLNLQIASDIHIENTEQDWEQIIKPKCDILVLAGNIGSLYKYYDLCRFLRWTCTKFRAVLYVLGDGEYSLMKGKEPRDLWELCIRADGLREVASNLHVLTRGSVIIQDVWFIGTTLWKNSDITYIKDMSDTNYNKLFEGDLRFIQQEIDKAKSVDSKVVVISHFAPTLGVCKGNDKMSGSNLDKFLTKTHVHTWIYGHTGKNYDFFTDGGTRVVTNQYNHDNYKPDKVIRLFY